MTERIKFGLALQNYVATGENIHPKKLVAEAARSEELGYNSVWVWDHILLGSRNVFPVYDSLTMLTAVATETTRVRLGTGVLVLSLRNPVVLAKQVATMDNLSDGRITLGVAAGWYQREFEACGIPFDTRGRILQVNVEVMKRLWTEDRVSGSYGQKELRNVNMEPKPIQKPHVPIWMGGYTDQVLKRVGRLADGWISYFYTPESFAKTWNKVLRYAQANDKQPTQFGNCDMVPARVDDNDESCLRTTSGFISKYCDLPAWSEATPTSAIAGTRKTCLNKIEQYLQAGVQELVIMPAVKDLDEIKNQLELFGKDILPSFN
jgi:alkanesulfonate monooxygenase